MYCLGYCTPLGYIIAMLWPKGVSFIRKPNHLRIQEKVFTDSVFYPFSSFWATLQQSKCCPRFTDEPAKPLNGNENLPVETVTAQCCC